VPVNPDSVFLLAERTTLLVLISSYIAKFLDPSSGYDLVVLGIHACLYVVLPGELPPRVFKNVPRCRFLVFVQGFRSCPKLLQFIRFWEIIHSCVVADVSAVPSNSPCLSLSIHDSRSYSCYLKYSPCCCRHPIASFDSIWSSSRVYSWCFVGQARS
jgi:hypothetical protein